MRFMENPLALHNDNEIEKPALLKGIRVHFSNSYAF